MVDSVMPMQGAWVWIPGQAERQGDFKQAIMYDYNNQSNKKQVEETVFN